MKIAVFGVGGVGGLFGGRLARSGEDVTFIARGEHLRAIRSEGLRVDSVNGDFVVQPTQATDDPSDVGPVDVVLVAVKGWQVPEAVQAMRPLVGQETVVVPLLNGVEAVAQLADMLGREHVAAGLCKAISFVAGPGHIRHTGAEPYIAFGELDNRRSERIESLRRALERADVAVEVPPDIQAAVWEKFIFIAGLSGVAAVTRSPAGVIRSLPESRDMVEQAMREILAVAQARGVALTEEAVGGAMAYVNSLPHGGTTSMQRDIMEGRPSELESQTGAVVRLGREAEVETPVNNFIYHALLPMELQARGQL